MKLTLALLAAAGLLGAYAWPHIVMMRCLEGDARAFGAVQGIREKVAAYRTAHGRPPASLAEVGIPALELYSYDGNDETVHRHRHIDQEAPLPAAGGADEGLWLYDPKDGRVVLGCSGVDTKHRRPWNQY